MNAPYEGDRGQDAEGADRAGLPHDPPDPTQARSSQQSLSPYGQQPASGQAYGGEFAYPVDPTVPYGSDSAYPEAGAYPETGPYPETGAYPETGPYPQGSHSPLDAYSSDAYPQDAYPHETAAAYPPQQYGGTAYPAAPYAQGDAAVHPQQSAPYTETVYPQHTGHPGHADAPAAQHAGAAPYLSSPGHHAQAQTPAAEPLGPGGGTHPYQGGGHPQAPGPHPQAGPHHPHSPRQGGVPASGGGHPRGPADRGGEYVGVDDLVSQAGPQEPQHDAFAHLFRDQGQNHVPGSPTADGGEVTAPETATPAPKPAGKFSSVLKSSAIMAAGTMVSRLTGFIRTIAITAALGSILLGDAFTVAYTLPTMIYILTVGGGLNSVFVPQLVRAMKEDEDGGEAYANRLLTLVMVALGAITLIVVLAAPLLIKLQSYSVASDPAANNVAVTFARYCLPTIFFMGVHVVMGQILNARGKFGAMMWTPVLNNVVMIFTFGLFIWVYGTASTSGIGVTTIPDEGVRLLGIGTLLGLVVQSLAMIPYLREAGFRFRPRFDWRGSGLGKTVKLAKWTVLFVLANQAGLLVVTQLSTAAGKESGAGGTGFLAYTNAQLIWAMPQAIITVSVMAALLPRISRAAADEDSGAVRDDISQGLRTSAVAIVPVSFAFIALGIPVCTLLYSTGGSAAAVSMGHILMAFGLGLIPYSVQYVVLRGFYAYEDTRTPFYNTVIVAAVNAVASAACYLVLPARWAVIGMAASYGLAYAVGVGVAWKRLKARLGGDLDGAQVVRTYARLCMACVPAAVAGGAVAWLVMDNLGKGLGASVLALVVGGVVLLGVFYAAARRMRIQELNSLVSMVRAKIGR